MWKKRSSTLQGQICDVEQEDCTNRKSSTIPTFMRLYTCPHIHLKSSKNLGFMEGRPSPRLLFLLFFFLVLFEYQV